LDAVTGARLGTESQRGENALRRSRTLRCVTKRTDRLLQDIEAGALDHRSRIGDPLRKVIALGGQSGSAELRDWAARELRGYGPDDELPPYRRIVAPLQVDMMNMRWQVKGQTISPMELPEFARDEISNEVELRMGITEIEQFARQHATDGVVRIQPLGAQELAVIMNAQGHLNGHLERIYWGVSPVALDGVVDQVRTTLTTLVAEINANMPDNAVTPSAEIATNAIDVAVNGNRNRISLAAPQDNSTVTTAASDEPRHWWRTAGAVILGLVAIAALIIALMQVQGWTFG
jgi:AbiTii